MVAVMWHVVLITHVPRAPSEVIVYIVSARNRDIAIDACIREAKDENPARNISEYTATPLDMSRPHKILQA
jgi:hypothetical protein